MTPRYMWSTMTKKGTQTPRTSLFSKNRPQTPQTSLSKNGTPTPRTLLPKNGSRKEKFLNFQKKLNSGKKKGSDFKELWVLLWIGLAPGDDQEEGEASHLNPEIHIFDNIEDEVERITVWSKIWYFLLCCRRFFYIVILFFPLMVTFPLVVISKRYTYFWWWLGKVLTLLGGSWIKLGQWASTRPDIFSAELVSQVSSLCHNCPAHPFSETKKIIEKAYGVPLESKFRNFSEIPIASGAIAQVHEATLVDGTHVAVKVLHPGIALTIKIDLSLMSLGAEFLEKFFPVSKWLSLSDAIFQFSGTMRNQSDLRIEARNLFRFNENFSGNPKVHFPKIISGIVPKREVLVETFEEGESLAKFLNGPVSSESRELAKIGLDAYLKMMLIDNFLHADLHPGNILVRKKDDKLSLVILDVGLVSSASKDDWDHFKALFKAVVDGDGKYGAQLMVKFARDHKITEAEEENFSNEMSVLFASVRYSKLSSISVGKFLNDVLSLVRKYKVKIEGNFATLCVGTIVLEGIGRQLDPEMSLLDASVPILVKGDVLPGDVSSKGRFLWEFITTKLSKWWHVIFSVI